MSSTASQERRLGIVARAGSWAGHHRRLVLIGWIVLLVGSLGISHAVGTNYSTNFSLPGTESQRATDLLQRDFPAQSGDSDQIVLRAREGQIAAPAVRAQVEPMLKQVAALPHVTGVAPVVMQFSTAGTLEIIYGIDLKSFEQLGGPFHYLSGGPFQEPNDVLVDDIFAKSKHARVGDTIELLNNTFRIVQFGMKFIF